LSKEFLLEIGTEEIPSRFINGAVEKMKDSFTALLAAGRVASQSEIMAYGTPRRLILHASVLPETAGGCLKGSDRSAEKSWLMMPRASRPRRRECLPRRTT